MYSNIIDFFSSISTPRSYVSINDKFYNLSTKYATMKVINLNDKFQLFNNHWHPYVIEGCNGQDVKIAKVLGEFVWHDHKDEDELFLVVKGILDIHFDNEIKTINQGEMIVIPKGVRHKPVAKEECWIMLIEPQTTKHTGDEIHELTVTRRQKI